MTAPLVLGADELEEAQAKLRSAEEDLQQARCSLSASRTDLRSQSLAFRCLTMPCGLDLIP